MKIDYPIIKWEDVQSGDLILTQFTLPNEVSYREYTVTSPLWGELRHSDAIAIHYLIDRPQPVFPEDYGTLIIAKRVRGTRFPDGIVLARQRGNGHGLSRQLWKSIDRKIEGADQHPENHIHDWVLAKAVPADEQTQAHLLL